MFSTDSTLVLDWVTGGCGWLDARRRARRGFCINRLDGCLEVSFPLPALYAPTRPIGRQPPTPLDTKELSMPRIFILCLQGPTQRYVSPPVLTSFEHHRLCSLSDVFGFPKASRRRFNVTVRHPPVQGPRKSRDSPMPSEPGDRRGNVGIADWQLLDTTLIQAETGPSLYFCRGA